MLAKEQISNINEHLIEKEVILEYDELKRIAWAAELANDFQTMYHIADVMVKKDQESKVVTSLNSDPRYLIGTEEKRLLSTCYDSQVKRLQSAIDLCRAVSDKRSYDKLKVPVINYLKKLI